MSAEASTTDDAANHGRAPRWIAIALGVLFAFPSFAIQSKATTVILVRHAEKAAPSGDPPLTAEGTRRAEELARVLADVNVRTIYVTQYIRTKLTAEPLARARGIVPQVVTANDRYAATVAADILAHHRGETVVVVGHSNTTPDLLRQLGAAYAKAIPDTQYDDLFVCTVTTEGAVLLPMRYGAASR